MMLSWGSCPPAVVRSGKSMRGNYTAVILCSRCPHPPKLPPTLGLCHLMPLEGKTAHCSCLCNRKTEHQHQDATLHQFIFPPRVADVSPSTENSQYREPLTDQQYCSEAGDYLFSSLRGTLLAGNMMCMQKKQYRTFLVVQGLRIHLPIQETQVDPWSRKIPHAYATR